MSEAPFEAVIHTASPYHFRARNAQELLGPGECSSLQSSFRYLFLNLSAIGGTMGILKSIKKNAPNVKRVVITSSAAAILDPAQFDGKTYSEVFQHVPGQDPN